MEPQIYRDYVNILKEELVPAMGCTEPIAIAYAAAVAHRALGALADRMGGGSQREHYQKREKRVRAGTGGLRGIPAAAAAGMAVGDPDLELEVLSKAGEAEQAAIQAYLEKTPIAVKLADSPHIFDILIRAWCGEDQALVRIVDYHTTWCGWRKTARCSKKKSLEPQASGDEGLTDRSCSAWRVFWNLPGRPLLPTWRKPSSGRCA